MTMLLIDSQRRSALQWLNTLQDTAVDLQRRLDENQARIAAMEQEKRIKASEIGLIEAQEKALRETRLVYGPAPSTQPVVSRSLILALSLLLGAFLGLMAAFIAGVIANVKARLQGEAGESEAVVSER
jgi:anti-sigma factor RsiW